MGKKLTNEEVIRRIKEVHGDKYLTDKVNYTGSKNHIILTCRIHGDFPIRPDCAYEGQGCPICRGTARHTTEQFIHDSNIAHDYKYDYSKSEYWHSHDKICVMCHEVDENGEEHGEFWPIAGAHAIGKQGCPKCALKIRARKDNEQYIKEAKEVHGELYDYSETKYITRRNLIYVRCRKHGLFPIMPYSHLNGVGCPICAESHLETDIRVMFEKNNILHEREKKFDWLKNKITLPLDFYLPEYNMAIECQGGQHFYPVKAFGGDAAFKRISFRDTLKKQLCDEHGVELIYYTNVKNAPDEYLGLLFRDKEELLKYIFSKKSK